MLARRGGPRSPHGDHRGNHAERKENAHRRRHSQGDRRGGKLPQRRRRRRLCDRQRDGDEHRISSEVQEARGPCGRVVPEAGAAPLVAAPAEHEERGRGGATETPPRPKPPRPSGSPRPACRPATPRSPRRPPQAKRIAAAGARGMRKRSTARNPPRSCEAWPMPPSRARWRGTPGRGRRCRPFPQQEGCHIMGSRCGRVGPGRAGAGI